VLNVVKPTGMMFGLALFIDMSRKNRFLENQFVERKEWLRKVVNSLANCDCKLSFIYLMYFDKRVTLRCLKEAKKEH